MTALTKARLRVWLVVTSAAFVVCWLVPIIETSPHGKYVSAWVASEDTLRWDSPGAGRLIGTYTALFGIVSAVVGWGASLFVRVS